MEEKQHQGTTKSSSGVYVAPGQSCSRSGRSRQSKDLEGPGGNIAWERAAERKQSISCSALSSSSTMWIQKQDQDGELLERSGRHFKTALKDHDIDGFIAWEAPTMPDAVGREARPSIANSTSATIRQKASRAYSSSDEAFCHEK